EVRFGMGLGNLASYSYSLTPPEVTDIVVGIGGEGRQRVFYRFLRRDPLWPGLVREEFVDRRDVNPDAQPSDDDYVAPEAAALASADERFAEAGGKASVTFVPIDTDAVRWGRDYWLGDVVTAETEIGPVTDVIREVRYTRSAEDGQRIEPAIGEPQDTPAIYRRVARLRRAVDQRHTRRRPVAEEYGVFTTSPTATETAAARLFRRFAVSGVVPPGPGVGGLDGGEGLEVTADGTNLVSIGTGYCIAGGYWYRNTGTLQLPIVANPSGLPRRDLLVVRADPADDRCLLAWLTGTPGSTQAPTP